MPPNKPDSSTSPLSALKRAPLFTGIDDGELRTFAQACYLRRFAAGDVLYAQADESDAAYVVASGVVAIILTTADGRELIIGEFRAGECIGEVAVITGSRHSSSAVGREAGAVVVIPRAEFAARAQSDARVAPRLVGMLAARLRDGIERERALAFLDAPTRLARALLELDRVESARGYVTISQEELAQRIGATRQTTAKVLGLWRRRGWIVTGRGRIVVLDRSAVTAVAGEA